MKNIFTDFFHRFIEKNIKETMINTIKNSEEFPVEGSIYWHTITELKELHVVLLKFNRKSIYKNYEIQPDDNSYAFYYVEDIINSEIFKDLFNNLLKDLSGNGPQISWAIRECIYASSYSKKDDDVICIKVFLRVA
jgi:hypothetical protein